MTAESAADEQPKTTVNENIKTNVPAEVLDIFQFLSGNDRIIFKSQQIDDPELQRNEKVNIAHEIYTRSRQTFLNRFGAYLTERYITYLTELFTSNANDTEEGSDDEVALMLSDLRRKLETRKLDVKNRRYAALQQLIQNGEYFSEVEMMKREPELYQDLVGQYLSEQEKKDRDGYDVRNTTFSGILMHRMQQQELDDILKEADKEIKRNDVDGNDDDVEEEEEENMSSTAVGNNDTTIRFRENTSLETYEVPVACRQQWGNFDDEKVACSTSKCTKVVKSISAVKRPKEIKFITAGERELLRQEFVGLMHEQFLAGLDKEFDYTEVDDNSQLDDLRQLNQDKEDEYFEESDDEISQNNSDIADESDDELDIYMSHLQKHHHLQQ